VFAGDVVYQSKRCLDDPDNRMFYITSYSEIKTVFIRKRSS
jgi:hypothetical protein